MPSPGVVLVFLLTLQAARPQHAPAPTLPCCFASAQNATSLGPVVVLRRDDEKPSAPGGSGAAPGAAPGAAADPTWEATLRRAATRALTWEGLSEAPFVDSHHSAEVLASLDEPSDIRVLARGLLVSAPDGRPVFREVDLPGERCLPCPADQPGPNGESIKAMWSVRRIRHSGPNADHRPCYELQFSVTPIVAALVAPQDDLLGRAVDVPDWRAGLRAESRVSRQGGRELKPKGLILRVNPQPAALLASTTPASAASEPRAATTSTRVHEHLHHHFYVRDGVPMYAGSTAETEYPTKSFRPSAQYHEYSQPDPLFHPRPAPPAPPAYPNSINEQLPPAGDGADTRVPYVSATKQTAVPITTITPRPTTLHYPAAVPITTITPRPTTLHYPAAVPITTITPRPTNLHYPAAVPITTITPRPTTLRFPTEAGPTVTMLPSQMYRVTGSYTVTTPTRRPTKAKGLSAYKTKVPPNNYYEIGRPTKVYPKDTTFTGRLPPPTSTLRPAVTSSEFLSEYPAATVRGTTPGLGTSTSAGRLFTPHYGDKDFQMSILKVMTSKVPSYIDIFTENGVRVTTAGPVNKQVTTERDNAVVSSTRLFRENPYGGPYSLINSSSGAEETKLSTTLQTRRPYGEATVPTVVPIRSRPQTTPESGSTSSSPLQITFFVASEDETKQPSASTLVSDPYRQDDTTTYQYTILRSVKQSIDVMSHENDTNPEGRATSTEPMSLTRRIFTSKDDHIDGEEEYDNMLGTGQTASAPDSLRQSVINGHTNHRNLKLKNNTENHSQILKNLSLTTEATTTRRPWRPSTTKRPWRQRSSYKQFYTQRKRLNHTTTSSSIDPTSIIESRKTYSVTASRKRKPILRYQGNSYHQRAQKLHRRRDHQIPIKREEIGSESDSNVQQEN